MDRREFLKTMGVAAAGAALGPAAATRGSVKGGESTPAGEAHMQTEAEELVAYCGSYCGNCGISGFNIGKGLAAVQNVVEAAAFKREAQGLGWPLMRDLATHCCTQFEDQVQSFSELATKFFPSNCRGGCVPPCQIAGCCKSKGYVTCADCSDLASCAQMADVVKKSPKTKQNLQAIADQGIKKWAETQFAAAKESKKRLLMEAVEKAFE